jgi:alkylation response protein AidB-like acyl-CoA dehydrogenase
MTDGAAQEPLDRARQLLPLIAASADQAERERRLPGPLQDALLEAGLYRLLLPRALGGGEIDPVTFVRIMEEIGAVDASTAWCLCQASGCSMVAAYLSPEAAWEVFGSDPRAVLAWGPGPGARAVAVDGGYRVSGTWAFASGGRHATWFGGYCPIFEVDGTPRQRPGGSPDARTMLFPAACATMIDVWHVIGLRGTGSDSYSVTDLLVPREHSLVRDSPAERRHPGPLYCFTSGNLYASGFAGVALGLARTMLDALVGLARDKTPRGFSRSLRESTVVQADVARAEARLGAARAFLLGSLEEIWGAVRRTGQLELARRVRIRLAATHAIEQAVAVVDMAYHAAGATAIFESGAFERRFRDIHAVAQQMQGRATHFETVGQFLLGLPPDPTYL